MFTGAHVLLTSENPEADRAFLRDVLEFPHVDTGEGWLIFKLPPAELGLHPQEEEETTHRHAGNPLLGGVLYLMCDDLSATVAALRKKKVRCRRVVAAPWGKATSFRLPSGGEVGLYQPRHPVALQLRSRK